MGLAPGLPATELKRSLQVGPQTRPRVSQVPPVVCTRPFPAALRADLVTLVLFPALSASGNDAAAPQPPARPVPSAGMAIRGTARAGSRGRLCHPHPRRRSAPAGRRGTSGGPEGARGRALAAAGPGLSPASGVRRAVCSEARALVQAYFSLSRLYIHPPTRGGKERRGPGSGDPGARPEFGPIAAWAALPPLPVALGRCHSGRTPGALAAPAPRPLPTRIQWIPHPGHAHARLRGRESPGVPIHEGKRVSRGSVRPGSRSSGPLQGVCRVCGLPPAVGGGGLIV